MLLQPGDFECREYSQTHAGQMYCADHGLEFAVALRRDLASSPVLPSRVLSKSAGRLPMPWQEWRVGDNF